jgi:hypothetical protein
LPGMMRRSILLFILIYACSAGLQKYLGKKY